MYQPDIRETESTRAAFERMDKDSGMGRGYFAGCLCQVEKIERGNGGKSGGKSGRNAGELR